MAKQYAGKEVAYLLGISDERAREILALAEDAHSAMEGAAFEGYFQFRDKVQEFKPSPLSSAGGSKTWSPTKMKISAKIRPMRRQSPENADNQQLAISLCLERQRDLADGIEGGVSF